jgi:hypothetical protein
VRRLVADSLVVLGAALGLVGCGSGVQKYIDSDDLRGAEDYCARELPSGTEDQHFCLVAVGQAYQARAKVQLADGRHCAAYSSYQGALANSSLGSEWQFEILSQSVPALKGCAETKRDGELLMACAQRAYSLATVVDVKGLLEDGDRRALLDAALACATQAEGAYRGCGRPCLPKWAEAGQLKAEVYATLSSGLTE